MSRIAVIVVSLVVLVLSLTSLASAAPEAGQYFFGLGSGTATLNNDGYIYGMEPFARQPELAAEQSHQYKGPVYSLYAGRIISSQETDFMGSSTFNLGVQTGYTNLGEYTITVQYPDTVTDPSGYRKLEESAVNLLVATSLYWENGFNLFAKTGVARLQGTYEQKGIISYRQPEINLDRSISYVYYRPEIAAGIGYLISDKVNIHVQYASILGPEPNGMFNGEGTIEIPNTLYQADSLTIGVTFYW